MDIKRYQRESLRDEKGMILVVSLMMISALLLLGTTAVMTSTTDMKINANYKTGIQAYYAAEAGLEEARARLRATFLPATGATGRIVDLSPTSATWSASICPTCTYTSSQSAITYTASIVHSTNAGGSILYYWDANGDGTPERTTTAKTDMNIYLVTSTGSASGAQKTIEIEMTRLPPITVPGPLYVEANTKIMGSSTSIVGTDGCGTDNKPGVVTTLAGTTVTQSGNPVVAGTPPIASSSANMNVNAMLDSQKGAANYSYDYTSNQVMTGMHWGTPVMVVGAPDTTPSTCDVSPPNIVYFNMHDTSSIKLSGGSSGCGILLVDGDLEVSGGFSWNGLIMVTGSVTFTGGAADKKNITGGVVAGNEVDASLDLDVIGGSISLVYCSTAINNLTAQQPLKRMSWKEQGM
ncbi:MAG: pilus assembly PilX N-terminal domain-containing protein [Syntrophales bacterium]|nr:pilus assembly PilX N-terminal domain-containing protein [Syntrophales bacterium]